MSGSLKVTTTPIPGLLILEPRVFGDDRGFFQESFNQRAFKEATGLDLQFVQDNHSRSTKGVLRGLHYQMPPHAQGKLVRVVTGAVFDVAVDIREDSPTFGRFVGIELSAGNHRQLWIPPGFAHGFQVLSDTADFLYKTTDYYAPASELVLAWDESSLDIPWPLKQQPSLSARDAKGLSLSEFASTVRGASRAGDPI
jgi:dTDP-4-dehydrorhamnose 3,5-epimerase